MTGNEKMTVELHGGARVVRFVADGADAQPGTTRDGATHVCVAHPTAHRLWLRLPEQSVLVTWARTEEGTWIWHQGRARFVSSARESTGRVRGKAVGAPPGAVSPPMPATVVRVLVDVGQTVQAGQALVVVSAMKMETTLSAPRMGVVRKVNARVGASVRPGDRLVDIEEEADAKADT